MGICKRNVKVVSCAKCLRYRIATMMKFFCSLTLLAMLATALSAEAAGLDDPFSVNTMVPSPADAGTCEKHIEGKQLNLADVIQISLCNNPQTRAAWAAARSAAAQLGASKSSLLPTLSLSGAATHAASATGSVHSVSNQQSASLSASYLLYDFGGREAGIDNALALLDAANASGNATLQSVFLNAATAYFSLMSARASVEASRASEASARASLSAAVERYKVGAATPADRLQAKTALAQAKLTRITAEGTMNKAFGTLANAMGMSPTAKLEFADPAPARPDVVLENNVGKLIREAQQQRPDLAAAEARIRASGANIESVRAAGLPQLSVDASLSDSRSAVAGGNYANTGGGSIALNISFPIFTGFNTTYQTLAAEAELENTIATRDQLAQQVTLQVWQAYQNLRTQGEALRTSDDLLASASESEAMSLGRYREGVGNILDLLTAQSAMASARQQHVSALYNWHAARFSLAQAVGALDLTALQKIRRMEQ